MIVINLTASHFLNKVKLLFLALLARGLLIGLRKAATIGGFETTTFGLLFYGVIVSICPFLMNVL